MGVYDFLCFCTCIFCGLTGMTRSSKNLCIRAFFADILSRGTYTNISCGNMHIICYSAYSWYLYYTVVPKTTDHKRWNCQVIHQACKLLSTHPFTCATKYPCSVCTRNVTSHGVSYMCNRCSGWVYSKCSGLQNATEYRRIRNCSISYPPTHSINTETTSITYYN